MCGVAGFLSLEREPAGLAALTAMTDRLSARGPDAEGFWTDPVAGVYFGHRRLSVLDLSESGSQPMVASDGDWVLTFNGEIYNHSEMRGELKAAGAALRGRSDTEVFLEWIVRFGLLSTLKRANGMFAFALWNRSKGELSLGRDRFGEKPLHWGWNGPRFFFASELKALRAHPAFQETLCLQAVPLFLRLGYVPAPLSIAEGISKLLPGEVLTLKPDRVGLPPKVWKYWDAMEEMTAHSQNRECRTPQARVSNLEAALKNAVMLRAEADVPVGAFLSGGVDSSLIVALMQEALGKRVRTFSVGFTDPRFDEAPFAKAIAAHLGTEHSELYVTAEDAEKVVPDLAEHFDEPFGDPSQVPTLILSRFAKKSVTVCLSGDGGDELFGGYHRHQFAHRLGRFLEFVPGFLQSGLGNYLVNTPQDSWDRRISSLHSSIRRRLGATGKQVHRLGDLLQECDVSSRYLQLVENLRGKDFLASPSFPQYSLLGLPKRFSLAEKVMAIDTIAYLPNDVLTKADRASMAYGLETRVPFLDPGVFEAAWHFPLSEKIRGQKTKMPLRALLSKRVPDSLVNRPKMGFTPPVQEWLRGPLADWGSSLIGAVAKSDLGLRNEETPLRLWREHISGRANHTGALWNLLMLQSWRCSKSV